jgi:hypothetical protein
MITEGLNELRKRDDFELHVEMCRHYDVLRQHKNNGFLVTNTILVSITTFLFTSFFKAPTASGFIILVSLSFVGVTVCASWLLLLRRNRAYIEYHREKAGGKDLWTPPNAGAVSSKWFDRVPAFVFTLIWLGALIALIVNRRALQP